MVSAVAEAVVVETVAAPAGARKPRLEIVTNGRTEVFHTGECIVIHLPEDGSELVLVPDWEATTEVQPDGSVKVSGFPEKLRGGNGGYMIDICWPPSDPKHLRYMRLWPDASVSPEEWARAWWLAHKHSVQAVLAIPDYESWAHQLKWEGHEVDEAITALKAASLPTDGQSVYNWLKEHAKH